MESYDFVKVNPNCLPLECLALKKKIDGAFKNVPALDKLWAESRFFTIYEPPPSLKEDGTFPLGAKEDWMERMKFLLSDFQWLLSLEQFRFWSQLQHVKDSLNGAISFLQEGYPFYLLDELPFDNEIREIYNETQQTLFSIIMRLVTHSESKWEHITKSKLGEILYDSFIVTVPMIFDICLIYGHKNHKEVSKFVQTLLSIQPQYMDDIKKSVPFIFKVLTTIEEKFGVNSQLSSGAPVKLSKKEELKTEKMDSRTVRDLILYLLDSVATLDMFLAVFPPACAIYHSQGLELRLGTFYENVIPKINDRIQQLGSSASPEAVSDVRHKLDLVRYEILRTFRLCISSCTDTARRNKSEAKRLCEDYFNVLSESLAGKVFTSDYHKLHAIDLDLDVLATLCPEINKERREYVMQCVRSSLSESAQSSSPVEEISLETMTVSELDQPSTSGIVRFHSSQNHKSSDNITHDELSSLISEVKDILPHLGDGFVKACLEHFNHQTSQVINAVLENTLPEPLANVDPDMPWIPDELKESNAAVNGIGKSEDQENEVVEVQTKKYRNFKDMFNDKSHVHEMKDMYSKFGSVDTEASLYDDEYDDTYDDLTFVPPDGETTEEVRPFVTPRVLLEHDKSRKQRVEEEESEDEEEEKTDGPKPLDFCVNPEVMRARAEQRYQSRRRNNKPERDLVGKPKGQGQTEDVLRNRKFKSENKSAHANHNRQNLARRKRNMGMLPS